MVDICILLYVGVEKSVVVIKSYFVLFVVVLQFIVSWCGDGVFDVMLVVLLQQLCDGWNVDWLLMVEGFVGVQNLFVVGCGFGFGVVLEVVFKFKEICGLYVEVFSVVEVKYGLMVLVGVGFLVLFFVQDDGIMDNIVVVVCEFCVCGVCVLLVVLGVSGEDSLLLVLGVLLFIVLLFMVQSFYKVVVVFLLVCGYDFDVLLYLCKVMEMV